MIFYSPPCSLFYSPFLLFLRVIEEPECRACRQKFTPLRGKTGDGKNPTGRHIIQPDGSKRIDEGGNTRIMGKNSGRTIRLIQARDHLFKSLHRSMIEFRNEKDLFLLSPKLTNQKFSFSFAPSGRPQYTPLPPN